MILIRSKYFSKAELNKFKERAGRLFDDIKDMTAVSKDGFITTVESLRKRRRKEAANEIRKLKNGNPDDYRKYLKIRDEERIGNNKLFEKHKDELKEAFDSARDMDDLAAAMRLPASLEKYNKTAIDSSVIGDGIDRFSISKSRKSSNNNYWNTKKKKPNQPVYVYD